MEAFWCTVLGRDDLKYVLSHSFHGVQSSKNADGTGVHSSICTLFNTYMSKEDTQP
jgi:hypothetical protein